MSDCRHSDLKRSIPGEDYWTCEACGEEFCADADLVMAMLENLENLRERKEELQSSLTEMHDMCTLLVNGESVKDMDEVMLRAERLLTNGEEQCQHE